tara:strand:- start:1382 stop:1957 length:576 start_codon:yes stop_codon:yes gene_type:complete
MYRIFFLIIILSLTQSCGPVIGGLGAVAIGSAAKEKGLGTSLNDNVINVEILNSLYKWNNEIGKDLKISVNDGAVLITGKVGKPEQKIKITQIIWNVKGVNEVINKIQVTDVSNIKNIAKDLAALGEIRARILAHPKINSLNFTIDVVNGIAYLSGISSNEEEINLVTNIAKQSRFVTEVYNYIKINSEKR